MATNDAYLQLEYKMCAMNGVPLHMAVQDSMHVFWWFNKLTVELYLGKVDGEHTYETVCYPIIAVPHEWREFWKNC